MNFRNRMIRWMQGRYGMDALGKFLMILTVICIVLNMFIGNRGLYLLGLLLLVLEYVRMFSRNIPARYRENQKYLQIVDNIRHTFRNPSLHNPFVTIRERINSPYRIFKCPTCHQKIRIPKGHGRVAISCPKCRAEFMRNT